MSIPMDYERVGAAFGQGFANAVSNSLNGDLIVARIVQTAMGLFSNVTANDLGEQLGTKFAEFAKKAIESTGWKSGEMGSGVGSGVNDFLRRLVQDVNMKTITGDFIKEISDAFKEGISKMDMAGNMKHVASEFDAGMGVFRDNLFRQIDLLRDDIQSIFSNVARDITLKTLPWIALGGMILVGTPLLTLYFYKKAVHNIGRPLLAQEVRKVGVWDRTTDGVIQTTSSIWKATKAGMKWSTLVGTTGLVVSFISAVSSEIMWRDPGYGARVIDGLACFLGSGHWCNYSAAIPLMAATVGAGVVPAAINLGRDFYNFVKKSMKVDPQPVFSDEIQKRIDDLTRSTYNIKQNGGYMQNLLLEGPGGTGKTMISKYIARNSNMNYVMMSGGDLAQFIKRGEHVTEVNRLFDDAKSSHTPTIIFIDECESLCGDRAKNDRTELTELINAFLNHTGEPSKQIMIILATNRKKDLDPAVLDRMDHKLHIDLPAEPERKKIIKLHLPTFMTASERTELFTDSMIEKIAKDTEGFSGRTIFKMLNTISSKRAANKENKLTEQMVLDTVAEIVEQERPAPAKVVEEPPVSLLSQILSCSFLPWGERKATVLTA